MYFLSTTPLTKNGNTLYYVSDTISTLLILCLPDVFSRVFSGTYPNQILTVYIIVNVIIVLFLSPNIFGSAERMWVHCLCRAPLDS